MAFVTRAMSRHRGTPIWLEVVRLSRTDWRISDSRINAGESGRVLGYAEKLHHDRFEVVWITEPVRWAYTVRLHDALHGFTEGARFTGATQLTRDDSFGRPAPRVPHRVHRRTVSAQPLDTHVV